MRLAIQLEKCCQSPLNLSMEIDVAVPTPLWQNFTYESEAELKPGTRVLVPFGARKLIGVVVGERQAIKINEDFEIKPIDSVIDEVPIYSEVLVKMARWLSHYYLHPLGEVFRTMLPASATKTIKREYRLTQRARQMLDCDDNCDESRLLSCLFGKRESLTEVTLKRKLKTKQKEFQQISLPQLRKKGLVELHQGSVIGARRIGAEINRQEESFCVKTIQDKAFKLTPAQQNVFEFICEHGLSQSPPEKPFLLRGITGSGKTEIYLQLIATAIATAATKDGVPAQTLMLVPEISLTPQMTTIFKERFMGRVAVVHSALSDVERWRELEKIRSGEALILIGPRSAVFGPFANLALIIVDEEHDASYKQQTGLMYHGRDVAVLRGRLEGACVLLGSATPSLESFYNAKSGKYHLLQLEQRISGHGLPSLDLIESKPSYSRGVRLTRPREASLRKPAGDPELSDEVPFSQEVLDALRDNIKKKHQAIVLVNRRGYAYYLFSLNEKKALSCPQCSISLTMHLRSTILRCHYCDYQTTTDEVIKAKPNDEFLAVGYGSEKVENYLGKQLPGARIVRIDSDTVGKKNLLSDTLAKFRAGEIDVLVGTQILAKGHDFPNVTLIAILEIDQLLDLPDFRAGERTFQLIVQAAGRAGRAEHVGHVMLQIARENHPVIRSALNHDYLGFANRELAFRKACSYPPYAHMIAIEFNSADRRRLTQFVSQIERWIEKLLRQHPTITRSISILGPAIPPIETIRNRHRRTLILTSKDRASLWQFAHQFRVGFERLPADVRMKIDVDPQNLA